MDSLVTRGLLNLGNALIRRRDFAGAEMYYREGLTLATRSGSHRLEAFALLALSSLHSQLGRATDTAAEVEQAFTFFNRNNFARESIQSLVLLGRAQRDQGIFAAALDSFNRAATISAAAKDASLGALSHESVGSLEYELQNYPKALTEYQESLRLYTDKEHQGYAAIHCGQIFWQLGRYAEAQQMFQTAETLSPGFPTLAMELMRSRAEAFVSQGRYQEARRLLRQALAGLKGQSPAATADLKRSLGSTEMALGDVKLALRTSNEAYQLAIASHNPFSRADAALDLLGSRVASADWKGAVVLWAAEQNTVSRFPESHWRALALVAIANRSLGRAAAAQQIAHEANQQADGLRAQWGPSAFQVYLSRPDIQKLWRALQSALITQD
jgi:tetratricopeptide (TPR) repeat protein